MKIRALPLVLLHLLIVSCGGEEATTSTDPEPAVVSTVPLDASLSAEALTLREWEWYSSSDNRITAVLGRAVDDTGRPLGGATGLWC